MHESIKKAMGFDNDLEDKKVLFEWKKRTSNLCKPCWELHYCPYGPLVEDFPLLPPTRKEAKEHNEYLKNCIKTNLLKSYEKLDSKRKKWFLEEIKTFNPENYPERIPKVLTEASCRVFGHLCPAFFVSEPLTETKTRRKHSRTIPRDVMLKVVRRDGQICQECNQPVADDEVEFDHIIPFSKGGRSIVNNLRLVHKGCNRRKSASLNKILSDNPIEHLWELQTEESKKRQR